MQLGHAYLAKRCESADGIAEDARKMLKLLEDIRKERSVVECVLNLTEGNVRPMWG